MDWSEMFRQAQSGGGFNMGGSGFDFGDLGDIFGFGGGGRRQRMGSDIEMDVHITFQESVTGVDKEVSLRRAEVCEKCNGKGAEPGTKVESCSTCQGRGQVEQVHQTMLGAMRTVGECNDCHGRGEKADQSCKKCDGQGIDRVVSKMSIQIPAGISSGQSIRLSGQGEVGPHNTPAGDLYVHVRVGESDDFVREGDDIHSEVKIPYYLAVLGGTTEIVTVDGEVDLKIAAGTPSGKVFRLPGKGMPSIHGRGTGSHFVTIQIEIPTKLSRKEKKLINELQDLES